MPKMLALMAVQRQTAASRSTRPSMRLQHGVFGGVPIVILRRPLSKSAQMPSFRVSLGHLPLLGVGGFGGHALTKEKNKRFSKKNKAIELLLFEAIFTTKICLKIKGFFFWDGEFVVGISLL